MALIVDLGGVDTISTQQLGACGLGRAGPSCWWTGWTPTCSACPVNRQKRCLHPVVGSGTRSWGSCGGSCVTWAASGVVREPRPPTGNLWLGWWRTGLSVKGGAPVALYLASIWWGETVREGTPPPGQDGRGRKRSFRISTPAAAFSPQNSE